MNLEQDLQQVREKWIDIVTERNREKKWHLCVHTHPPTPPRTLQDERVIIKP
jgi:hypothetical protein